jgi:Trypsin-co-occurring domain 1
MVGAIEAVVNDRRRQLPGSRERARRLLDVSPRDQEHLSTAIAIRPDPKGAPLMQTVEFPLASGGQLLVRVADVDSGGSVVTRGERMAGPLEKAESTFEAALGTIRVVAQGVLGQLGGLARSPDEVRVEFGLELTAKAGAILAAAGTTAQLKVGLTWRPQAPEDEGETNEGGRIETSRVTPAAVGPAATR